MILRRELSKLLVSDKADMSRAVDQGVFDLLYPIISVEYNTTAILRVVQNVNQLLRGRGEPSDINIFNCS